MLLHTEPRVGPLLKVEDVNYDDWLAQGPQAPGSTSSTEEAPSP